MKKLVSLILAALLVLAVAIPAMAAGEGSITLTGVTKGYEYALLKVFELTGSDTTEPADGKYDNISYRIDPDWVNFFIGASAAGKEFLIERTEENKSDHPDLNQLTYGDKTYFINITEANVATLATKALPYAADLNGYDAKMEANDTTVVNDTLTFTGLDLGYYLVYPMGASGIKDGEASLCSLTSTVPAGEIRIKAKYPELDKNIVIEQLRVKENQKTIGQAEEYEIVGVIPDMTGYDRYIYNIEDTMSVGLTFNNDVKVYIRYAQGTLAVDSSLYEVIIDEDDPQHFTIVMKDFYENWNTRAGEELIFRYSATVNEQAKIVEPETNTAYLVYSRDPQIKPEGDIPGPNDPVGESVKIVTKTYTTKVKLIKVDGDDPTKTLTGAKFKVSGMTGTEVAVISGKAYQEDTNGEWYMLKDGTYTKQVPKSAGGEYNDDAYDSTTKKYSLVAVDQTTSQQKTWQHTGYVDASGVMSFDGLGEGTFTITELVAPEGYNMLDKPITVVINWDKENTKFTVKVDGEDVEIDADNTITINVNNFTGAELPETGGIGTTIFYVLGGILLVGAAVLLITKKRMGAHE